METQPKRLITRILEFAALLALSAFLIRLAVCYLIDVWPILLILVLAVAATIIGWCIWKNRTRW